MNDLRITRADTIRVTTAHLLFVIANGFRRCARFITPQCTAIRCYCFDPGGEPES